VKDEEERKRIEEDEEAFEKFLLDIYEEEYFMNGPSFYEVDVEA
jgi:hypothetical protein